MYNFFIERVKQNLHIVLAMSPIGDAFRNRLRMFPSLINCCTIDWFKVRVAVCMADCLVREIKPPEDSSDKIDVGFKHNFVVGLLLV